MRFASSRRFWLRFALMGVASASPFAITAARAEPAVFTIPAEDGYGIEDCMKAGSACGQVVANSWCEAHGHADALAFGTADDVTGTIPARTAAPTPSAGVMIRCGD